MNRTLQNTPYTASVTLYAGTVATDATPDSATVVVTRADGTAVTSGSAAEGGTGKYNFSMTPTQMALLDTLRFHWTATIGGNPSTVDTFVEVTGGFLCTLGDMATVVAGASDDVLAAERTAAEQRLEGACRVAFVPRYRRETRRCHTYGAVRVAMPYIRALRSISINGIVLSQNQLALVTIGTRMLSGLNCPVGANVIIGYEHGLDYPEEGCREAVIAVAREHTTSSTSAGRVVREEADNVAVTYASPSSSSLFDNPQINAFVRNHAGPLVA